jgi:hypothetical protein
LFVPRLRAPPAAKVAGLKAAIRSGALSCVNRIYLGHADTLPMACFLPTSADVEIRFAGRDFVSKGTRTHEIEFTRLRAHAGCECSGSLFPTPGRRSTDCVRLCVSGFLAQLVGGP